MANRGLNKAMVIGNVGNPPESRTTQSGATVVTFSVATSQTWKDKNTGQQQERTEWHNIKAFNRPAEIIRDYVQKGTKVYIEGSLRTDSWDDRDTGKKMFRTEIVAEELQILTPRGEPGAGGGGGHSQAAPARSPAPAPQAPCGGQIPSQQGFHDDDIPF